MSAEQFRNQSFPTAVLVSAIDQDDTTCVVSNQSNFSVLAAGQQFQMSIQDDANSVIELVTVTATVGGLFTIVRGGNAVSHVSGASVAQVVTAAQLAAMYPNGIVKTASPYVFDGSLPVLEIKPAAPAPAAVSIQTGNLVPFRIYYIADGSGTASANNITITPDLGLIGGAANNIISTNNGAIRFYWNGTGCRLV